MDPQGLNPLRPQSNERTKTQIKKISDKVEPGGSGLIPKEKNQAPIDNVKAKISRNPPYVNPQGVITLRTQ